MRRSGPQIFFGKDARGFFCRLGLFDLVEVAALVSIIGNLVLQIAVIGGVGAWIKIIAANIVIKRIPARSGPLREAPAATRAFYDRVNLLQSGKSRTLVHEIADNASSLLIGKAVVALQIVKKLRTDRACVRHGMPYLGRMRSIVLMLTAMLATPAFAAGAENCLLEVEGTAYIDGPCEIDVDGETTVVSGPSSTYFVYLDTAGDMSYWNEEAGAGHAHTRLGVLKQDGLCWVGEAAKVCFDQ